MVVVVVVRLGGLEALVPELQAAVGLAVVRQRVLHLLVDGLPRVGVGVRRGGGGRERRRVWRGRALAREHLAHHLDVDRLVVQAAPLARLRRRLPALEGQRRGRGGHAHLLPAL